MSRLIYAADDEQDIRDVLRVFLADAGYDVRVFSTGDALYKAFEKQPCDLAVLDIMMPGTDGLTICHRLRELSDIPIVLLTAKDSEMDQIRGFILGGDDYLTKPFSPSLLVVRVNALLRRADKAAPKRRTVRFGDLTYSAAERTVACGQRELGLTLTEFELLGILLEEPGAAVSRNVLLDRIWGVDDQEIETRVTDETVRRVRRKLRAAGSRVRIAAVWGYGYKLEDTDE